MIIMIVTLLNSPPYYITFVWHYVLYVYVCVCVCSLGLDPNHYVETKNAHKPFTKNFYAIIICVLFVRGMEMVI